MRNSMIAGWLDYYSDRKTELCNFVNHRKVLVWGAFHSGKYIQEFMDTIANVEGYIDSNKGKENYNGKPVVHLEELKKKSFTEYCIIIAVHKFRPEILENLSDNCFVANGDYMYIYHEYTISSFNIFEDKYLNYLVSKQIYDTLNVYLRGYQSNLMIEHNVSFGKNVSIILGSNAEVRIEEGVVIGDNTTIKAEHSGSVIIKSKTVIGDGAYIASVDGKIVIEEGCRIGKEFDCVASTNANIAVREKCLFSKRVSLRAASGHSIIDLDNKMNTVAAHKQHIEIGEHVWIAQSVVVLAGVVIGSDCVVGAGSLVTKTCQKNCLIVGNPARVVRENIIWDYRNGLTYEEYASELGEGVERK